MALTAITKAEIRSRAFTRYGEVAGGYEFNTAGMGTFIQNAVERMAMKSGCIVGSARRARPTSSTAEALLTLPTGMWGVNRVVHERHFPGATHSNQDIPHRTQQWLSLAYGDGWAYASSAEVGGSTVNEAWYRKGTRLLGFFPPNLVNTAGTAIVWGRLASSAMMANDTTPCEIAPEFIPGVVEYICGFMAERDADSDAEGQRAASFFAKGDEYSQIAATSSRQSWDIED